MLNLLTKVETHSMKPVNALGNIKSPTNLIREIHEINFYILGYSLNIQQEDLLEKQLIQLVAIKSILEENMNIHWENPNKYEIDHDLMLIIDQISAD